MKKILTVVVLFAALMTAVPAKAEVDDTSIKQQSIQIPINIRYGIGLGSTASIYFFAGPQFGFNVGDKSFTSFDAATATASSWTLKSSNLSANVGLGLMLLGHLQVSANYNFALGKTGEYQSIQGASSMLFEGDTKMNAWQIGLTYFF